MFATDWYELALPRGTGHDHADLTQHTGLSTANFHVVGHAALTTYDADGRLVGSWGCAELGERADGRVLAIMNAFGRQAFVLADITNPGQPFKVGEFVLDGVSGYDAALTRDGKFGLLAFNAIVRMPDLGGAAPVPTIGLTFESACTGETQRIPLPDVAGHNGLILLDLQDPANPTFGDYWPAPGVNLHSVATADVDGLQYVVASIVNLAPAASYWQFFLAVDTPIGGKLVETAHFQQPPATVRAEERQVVVPTFNGHGEATVQKHPVTGRVYAYLAAWDGGMITLDVTVPVAPVLVAMWAPPVSAQPVALTNGLLSTDCYPYAVHDAYPLPELRDGKHYLIAQQECPRPDRANAPAGQLFILDNTDPLFPTMVGRWNLPANTAPWTAEYVASPHYVAVEGDTLFASMYHAGVWAIDLTSDLTAPASIGVFLPDKTVTPIGANALAPSTLQVNPLPGGDLAVFEERTGVYVVRFDATNPGPAALPFFR